LGADETPNGSVCETQDLCNERGPLICQPFLDAEVRCEIPLRSRVTSAPTRIGFGTALYPSECPAIDPSPSFTFLHPLPESSHLVHLDLRPDPCLLPMLHKSSRLCENAIVACLGATLIRRRNRTGKEDSRQHQPRLIRKEKFRPHPKRAMRPVAKPSQRTGQNLCAKVRPVAGFTPAVPPIEMCSPTLAT